MKKILVSLFVIALCFTLVGCGSKDDKSNSDNGNKGSVQGSDKEGDGLENVTESNYAKVMKENYGIDPIYGDGWKIKEVKSPNKVNNLRVNYSTPKDIDQDEWTKKYFDATMNISSDGIYALEMNFDTGALYKGDKLTDYNQFRDGYYSGWYYYYNGREVQVNASIYPGDALIIFTFTN